MTTPLHTLLTNAANALQAYVDVVKNLDIPAARATESNQDLVNQLRAAAEQQAHPPGKQAKVILGTWGRAFDAPTTRRAYTYKEQPLNVEAWRLGEAMQAAAQLPAGDNIDAGLGLLKELQAAGFGVFEIGAEYTEQHPNAKLPSHQVEAAQRLIDADMAKRLEGGE